MRMFPLNIIIHQLYLLQLENYDLRRFWRVFWKKGFWVGSQRQKLAWTGKLATITAWSIILYLGTIVIIVLVVSRTVDDPVYASLIIASVIVAGWLLFGFWAMLAVLLVWPLDYVLKYQTIQAAKRKISRHPQVIIIGITGSYGKTTMKEVLATVLEEKYEVLKTQGNQNTPLGLARLIVEHLTDQTQILLVEMGAYQRGDIRDLCSIARPHLSILTGINESHLERFGSLDRTIEAKFEIVRYAREDAAVLLNADDELVSKHYHDHVKDKRVSFYSAYNDNRCSYRLTNKRFDQDELTQSADISLAGRLLGPIRTRLLGEYIFGDIIAAGIIGQKYGVPFDRIQCAVAHIKPIEHRLAPIRGQHNILVIDDSYNGSAHGVEEAIRVLERFAGRRKLYVTPGLVETGERAYALHHHIGRRLAKVADVVVLIRNSVTPYIEKGLLENKFPEEHIKYFKNAGQAHRNIQTMTKPQDVVLFQNDWPDNYI